VSQNPVIQASVTDTLIRDLVEQYPDTMRVLSPLGIDLCCGGGHPLGEALDLHEIDRASVIPQIEQIVAEQMGRKG
jgi:iron-sulfur cluster repair protein YtfE (RIC family)